MKLSQGNRGMGLESLIEHSNAQYAVKDIAHIQKIATPVKVTKILNGRIKDGFYEKKSTVDFIGIYKSQGVAFDAKSTKLKTRIPLSNFEFHQIQFLLNWRRNGGIAFYIIEFKSLGEIYALEILDFFAWYSRFEKESLTLDWVQRKGHKVEQGNGIVLDYLKHVEVPA